MEPETYKTNALEGEKIAELNFSQEMVTGFDLEVLQKARVLQIGAGAIGSITSIGLVRKGIGFLYIFDGDEVELKNLTRQLFSLEDEGKSKAICLARILSGHGFFNTTINGYPYRFQEALEMGIDLSGYDAVICGVDNNPTRVSVTEHCLKNKIPLIMSAVSRDGNQMYCAVQEPEKACFGCMMPHAINDEDYPCNLPGIIDIIQVVAGYTVFALDTILMKRHREWNLRMISLDGSIPDSSILVERKSDCALCGEEKRSELY